MGAWSARDLLRERGAALAHSLESFLAEDADPLDQAAEELAGVLARGGRLFVCGNGGSAAHASHFEAELLGRFHEDREPLPCIYLGMSASTATAIGNDFGGDEAFARPLQALCGSADGLLAISTSGTSGNVTAAVDVARQAGARSVLLTGPNAPDGAADVVVRFPGATADVIQEGHQLVIHVLVEAIEATVARVG